MRHDLIAKRHHEILPRHWRHTCPITTLEGLRCCFDGQVDIFLLCFGDIGDQVSRRRVVRWKGFARYRVAPFTINQQLGLEIERLAFRASNL